MGCIGSHVISPDYELSKGKKPSFLLLQVFVSAYLREYVYIQMCQVHLLTTSGFRKSDCLIFFSKHNIALFHETYLILDDHGAGKSEVKIVLWVFFYYYNLSEIPEQK